MGGYQSRRLSTRLWRLLAATGVASAAYCRWRVMPFHVTGVEAPHHPDASLSRDQLWERIDRSQQSGDVYDVCVVGGGAVGLYTAIDAAQRGLRVALLEASDYGSSRSSSQLGFLPGGFAFFQRALKQREPSAVSEACLAMLDITTWENVLGPEAVRRVVTWHPSQHSTETLELVLTALFSTCVAVFLGPVPCSAGRSLRSPDASAPPLQRRSIACEDAVIDYQAAILSLVHTLRALGATALNYAEVVSVTHVPQMELSSHGSPVAGYEVEIANRRVSGDMGDAPTRHHRIRSLSIVNCTGSSLDRVRQWIPQDTAASHAPDNGKGNEAPHIIERHSAFTYFVVPVDDVVDTKTRAPFDATSAASRGTSLAEPWAVLSNSVLNHSSSVSITPLLGMERSVLVGAVHSPVGPRTAACDSTTVTEEDVDAALPLAAVPEAIQLVRNQLNPLGLDLLSGRVASRLVCDVPTLTRPSLLVGGQRAAAHVQNRGFCVLPLQPTPGPTQDASSAALAATTTGHLDVLGGNIANSRRAAEEAVDRVVAHLHTVGRLSSRPSCRTRTLSLRSAVLLTDAASSTESETRRFVTHCVRNLYAQTVEDVLLRRTHAALADPVAAAAAAPVVAKLMAETLGWSQRHEKEELDAALRRIRTVAVTA